jgi:hypothetical protein
MVLEFPPEVFAVVSDALEHMRAEIGPRASNEEALQAMAETVLGKRRADPEHPPYQIVLTICAGCDRTWHHTGSEAIEVPESVGACGLCDGELVGATRIEEGTAAASTHVGQPTVPTRLSDALMKAASELFSAPRKSVTVLRKKHTHARDQHRCAVPGCRNHRFLEVHHLEPQAEGGGHDAENMTLLCSAHHRLYHEGYLAIEGTPLEGLRFRHAGGTLYGAPIRYAGAPAPS